jgi:hypothetical protein
LDVCGICGEVYAREDVRTVYGIPTCEKCLMKCEKSEDSKFI